jgi:hypothetical protein
MRGGDVIRDFGQDLLFGVTARLELASGNEIVAIKDFGHYEYPQNLKYQDSGRVLPWRLGGRSKGCQWYFLGFSVGCKR